MPSGRVGDLDAERSEELADPAVRRVERGERDAGDRGRQGEGQIDEGIDQPPAGKAIADQHPGDDQAEDGVDGGGGERNAEAHLEGGKGPRVEGDAPEVAPAEGEGRIAGRRAG